MKLQSLFVRTSLFVSFMLLFFVTPRVDAQSNVQSAASFQTPAVPARITQAIDETQLVRLKGNVHPLARPEFDQGAVPDSVPMNRMLLLLQRSPEQEAALQQLMAEQQAKDSPNFHKWLTPQQFGAQFGPADADIQTVTDWLTSQGFQGIKVAAGKTVIEFSGTAGQVRSAFQTEIHHYLVNGQMRQANIADPQIPAALTPVVAGIVSLHNFPRKSMIHRRAGTLSGRKENISKPLFTTTSGCGSGGSQPCYVVGPADFAKIYNVPNGINGTPPTPPGLLDGTGVTIALVADSNINPQDVIDFRALFGLPPTFTASNVILNGPDPGLNGDEGEADLDAQTAGMVAPGATINLVVSEDTLTAAGIDLSALYIINNNLAPIMSESFGICEPALGTGGNAFYSAIWEEAAAQGISAMVSAGDNGSAGCDDFTTQTTAINGLAVSGIASTPFNVAVGGTDFDDVGTQTNFWNPSTGNAAATRESAKGYIPEIPWNDSCAAGATSANLNTICATANNIVAASGGQSSIYTKTQAPWQNVVTPSDGVRDLPDVSLFASDGQNSDSFYLFCEADLISAGSPPSCAPDAQGHFSFFGAGGTSASSPAFAGIMALIVQQQTLARQGNPNPMLYKIAQSETFSSCNSTTMPLTGSPTCVFYDVTKGNNSVPCSGGSTTNCSSQTTGTNGVLVTASGSTTPAFTTGTGYDLATGLGTVNVTNLAAAWKTTVTALTPTNTATTINGGTSLVTITHGQSVSLSAKVTSASGTPTGDVSFVAPTTVDGGIADATLSGGTATLTVPSAVFSGLPGGSYNLKAHYAGSGTFAPSDDPTGVPVSVTPENSGLLPEMITFDSRRNITSTNATTFPYGSGPTFRLDILNHTGTASTCQPLVTNGVTTGCAFDATGSVTITDNGSALPGSPFTVNSAGHLEDQTIQLTGGTHALVATYSGDISYNPPSSPTTVSVTVTPASTSSALSASPNPVPTNQQVTLSVTIGSQSISTTGATGSVTFKDGSSTIQTVSVTPVGATSTTFAGGTATLTTTFATSGTHSLTAVYGGDTNYATSTSSAVSLAVGQTTTTTLAASPTTLPAGGGSVTLTATVAGTGSAASPTGTVQFMNGSTALGTAQTCSAVSGAAPPTCKANLTATLSFLAPPVGPRRIPTLRIPWTLLVCLALLLVLFLNSKRVPARYRRAYAYAGLLLLAVLVAGLATACGSGYGGGGGGVHYDSITAVYSGDATYAGSTSAAVQVTVQ
jgi:hypothetical protein